jgi:predicted GNAT family acetyltransferase
MNEIELKVNKYKQAVFVIEEDDEMKAELCFVFIGKKLIAYHTYVTPELRGRGIARELTARMVAYARRHRMKVIALCPYIKALFEKNPALYEDVWGDLQ